MKLFSYNCRGLASPDKKLAFCRLLSIEQVDVIFLQETLGLTEPITHLLESILPIWNFNSLDVNGRSEGIVMGYNTRTIKMNNIWGGSGFIGVDLYTSDLGNELPIINVYVSCQNQAFFSEHLLRSNLLQADNLILG